MNKQEYMYNLFEALRPFDEDVRNEIISDYEEHFADGLANGKTEYNISVADQVAHLFLNSSLSRLSSAWSISPDQFRLNGVSTAFRPMRSDISFRPSRNASNCCFVNPDMTTISSSMAAGSGLS